MTKQMISAEEINHQGTTLYLQERYVEAAKAYQEAINLRADFTDAYFNLGLALNKLKQLEAAMRAFEALIALVPQHVGGQFQLGCLLMQQASYQAAIKHFEVIIAQDPSHLETQINLGSCYLRLGKLQQARQYYLRALSEASHDAQVLFNLGVISAQEGDWYAAIHYYQRALTSSPDSFEVHNNIAVAYLNLRDKATALLHFRAALSIQPGNESIRHVMSILMQEKPVSHAPVEYVRSLFDSYADHYDQHLLTSLHYQVPEHMLEMMKRFQVLPRDREWCILDLGCGTGLCGELYRPYAKTMVGVDASPKMLAIAKSKGCYDELVVADILAFLLDKHASYELIVGGDVLVYFGDLEPLMSLVSTALKPGGMTVFNSEIADTEPFVMTGSGRFAHLKSYIDRLASLFGLSILAYQVIPLRTQEDKTVYGHLYLLKKDS